MLIGNDGSRHGLVARVVTNDVQRSLMVIIKHLKIVEGDVLLENEKKKVLMKNKESKENKDIEKLQSFMLMANRGPVEARLVVTLVKRGSNRVG